MTIQITGTGSSLPELTVTNTDLQKLVDTSDEWIRERTGIVQRRIARTETVADMAADACKKALEQAGKLAEEVELILVATCSPDDLLPCCACQVQDKLGARKATAFDLNAACAGFLFAMQTAYAYIQTGFYKNALIVGAEGLSKLIDWSDRSTCVLFGDGAGAAFIEADSQSDEKHFLSFVQGADGSKGAALTCGERSLSNPYTQNQETQSSHIQMNGQEVYRFAVKQVPASLTEAIEKAGLEVEDIDLFVLHQANVRIIEAVAKRLKADINKFPMNLERVGNMSSATIPVLLDEINRKGLLKKGQRIALSGFGAGLTYGACVLVW